MAESDSGHSVITPYVVPYGKTEFEYFVPMGATPVGVGSAPRQGVVMEGPYSLPTILMLANADARTTKQRWFVVKTGDKFESRSPIQHLGSINNGTHHVFREIRQ